MGVRGALGGQTQINSKRLPLWLHRWLHRPLGLPSSSTQCRKIEQPPGLLGLVGSQARNAQLRQRVQLRKAGAPKECELGRIAHTCPCCPSPVGVEHAECVDKGPTPRGAVMAEFEQPLARPAAHPVCVCASSSSSSSSSAAAAAAAAAAVTAPAEMGCMPYAHQSHHPAYVACDHAGLCSLQTAQGCLHSAAAAVAASTHSITAAQGSRLQQVARTIWF